MKKTLITSYKNPDVDGVGCGYAYSEFLRNKGIEAQAGFFGEIHREAQFVVDKFNIKIDQAEELINDCEDIILVDASEVLRVPEKIKPEQVIEIIDHRKSEDIDKFTRAKAQIELVGSCATLIAEKFKKGDMDISKEAAALLYSAIISNTLNFKCSLTTERDEKMADWLKSKIELPEDYVRQMFLHKSKFTQPLKEILIGDFKDFEINGEKIGIAQLEIIDLDDFIKENLQKVKELLSEIQKEKEVKYIFLTCVDLEKGFNVFITDDVETQNILEKVFKAKFKESAAKKTGIIMRKEIVSLLKKEL